MGVDACTVLLIRGCVCVEKEREGLLVVFWVLDSARVRCTGSEIVPIVRHIPVAATIAVGFRKGSRGGEGGRGKDGGHLWRDT